MVHDIKLAGELFRRTIKHGLAYYRRCVPPSLTKQILLACHDDKTAGHLGAHRTLDEITNRYYWPRMRRDIIRYVQSCADCQSKKKASRTSSWTYDTHSLSTTV